MIPVWLKVNSNFDQINSDLKSDRSHPYLNFPQTSNQRRKKSHKHVFLLPLCWFGLGFSWLSRLRNKKKKKKKRLSTMDSVEVLLNSLLLVLLLPSCLSISAITLNQSITGSNLLLSRKEIFALGFFSPGNSKYKYLGIWYHKLPEQTVVWVANRNNPINDTSGVLFLAPDGNLELYNNHDRGLPFWSTNVSMEGTVDCVACLLDSGNLVLVPNDESKRIFWQSFDYPTDTMLPGMKLGLDRRIGLERSLTSWRSADDPGTGDWLYRLNPSGCPQFFLYNGLIPYWRSPPWPWGPTPVPGYSSTSTNNQDEIYYSFHSEVDESIPTRNVVNNSGLVQRLTWDNSSYQWRVPRSDPKYIYGHCGGYSILNANNFDSLDCMCLPGYEPKSIKNWYLRDGSAGCVRKREQTMSMCRNGEGFVKVEHLKVPDTSIAALMNTSLSSTECEQLCLNNCSCKAFAVLDIERKGVGCLTWYGQLMDTTQYSEARELYVRVDAIELAEYKKKERGFLKKKGRLAIPILSVGFAIFLIVIFAYLWLSNKRKTGVKKKAIFSILLENELIESRQSPDLPIFNLRTISAATNNFSPANKLGQGGFGSVYKGRLHNGQEIAVKRLSQSSGQGIEEFKNEVALIARLQHRNLIKLLGCCIHREEQMLIYEYLPNKSLDCFIFDQRQRSFLDWNKRFDIIVGIARGILYLHHDSRLRIIHRDLKTSNILLDADMNPKISDFGMARIFRGDEVQDKTNRVVGTYGYMAPEYVMFGKFSTKSDVFSFGVMLLEIISGKKSNTCYPEDPSLNLIGHVSNGGVGAMETRKSFGHSRFMSKRVFSSS
ncbi:G-type lectin S-receptor-like serine/threonine-protein kinase RKS1 isoform X3 [Hevea brasiliensis]|uniref:G-type lectin S-receptor-like serine/threonine-protein kinase RKS1 isoform X3 n=1 Tax=Hevea brasiliensis TaxID=3981 RepID=UPI0025D5CDC5|nr:G-type lectin S-receptor-like serine/threonine-protein kinase RKS1 isoform X3 [Hevea brasiliensis]